MLVGFFLLFELSKWQTYLIVLLTVIRWSDYLLSGQSSDGPTARRPRASRHGQDDQAPW
jgi:hypothetical protein